MGKEDAVVDDARELILQDVRCFQDEQRGRLRPITLLVGENSTGKTTFLGCYRVLHRMFSMRGLGEFLDFNEEPFAMGSFRDVVRSRRGRSGRIEEFKIGFLMVKGSDDPMSPYEMSFTFRERGSEPVVSSLRFQFDPDAFLEMRSSDDMDVGYGVSQSLPILVDVLERSARRVKETDRLLGFAD